jgi:hypothetical protein
MGNLRNKKHFETIMGAICIILVYSLLVIASLDALDRSIYPGCKVLDQQADVLIIELDPRFDEPTDGVCQQFGDLVYRIAQDGYQVQVVGGHFEVLGVITKEKAKKLAEGY